MKNTRLPRFRRVSEIAPMQLTKRALEILLQILRHRFLRSRHVVDLLGGSRQQILRRLQLLFHHGYIERPRAQIDYYHRGGSRHMVYGLGNKGVAVLRRDSEAPHRVDWSGKNRAVGRLFLEHALLISDILVSLEVACRNSDRVRFIPQDQIRLPGGMNQRRDPFRWSVTLGNRQKLSLIPDAVFALEFDCKPSNNNRIHFFLEADRGTMPIQRERLSQTSFLRKILTYQATWMQGLHRTRFGFNRFRVLTVTTNPQRVDSLVAACMSIQHGQGLFLFGSHSALANADPLVFEWRGGRTQQATQLLDCQRQSNFRESQEYDKIC